MVIISRVQIKYGSAQEDIYGYRGRDDRVYYLSPWEFTMFWEVERVPRPEKHTEDGHEISCWTGVQIPKGTSPEPGIHYIIDDALLADREQEPFHVYVALPDIEELQIFRHEWVLRRAHRPFVPQPDSTPMPDRARTVEQRARLYSVYLRPWVLSRRLASRHVPHLSTLDEIPPRQRLPSNSKVQVEKSFALAWRDYIRGHIVSMHAKKIISQFMAACCGKSKTDNIFLGEEAIAPSPDEKMEGCDISLNRIHRVLREASNPTRKKTSDEGEYDIEESTLSEQMKGSMRLGSALWSLDAAEWSGNAVLATGHIEMKDSENAGAPSSAPKKRIHIPSKVCLRLFQRSSAAWFDKIMNESIRPNAEQLAYLQEIRDRCACESRETISSESASQRPKFSEPYRKCLLGPPGTGKSECIRWTRRFFEEVMKWSDGVQLQMVAPQHTMALLIGGRTARRSDYLSFISSKE